MKFGLKMSADESQTWPGQDRKAFVTFSAENEEIAKAKAKGYLRREGYGPGPWGRELKSATLFIISKSIRLKVTKKP